MTDGALNEACEDTQVSEEAAALAEVEGKVAAVTEVLRAALQALNARMYIRPLLTSYSALGDVHSALRLIKDAKEEQLAGQKGPRPGEHSFSLSAL